MTIEIRQLQPWLWVVDMPSSDPDRLPYRVTLTKDDEVPEGLVIECECRGFEYRQTCRHRTTVVNELKRVLAEKQKESK